MLLARYNLLSQINVVELWKPAKYAVIMNASASIERNIQKLSVSLMVNLLLRNIKVSVLVNIV